MDSVASQIGQSYRRHNAQVDRAVERLGVFERDKMGAAYPASFGQLYTASVQRFVIPRSNVVFTSHFRQFSSRDRSSGVSPHRSNVFLMISIIIAWRFRSLARDQSSISETPTVSCSDPSSWGSSLIVPGARSSVIPTSKVVQVGFVSSVPSIWSRMD